MSAANRLQADRHFRESFSCLQAGDAAGAIAALQASVDCEPRQHPLYNLGILLAAAGRHEEALASFARCIGIAPGFGQAWVNRALSYLALGRAEEAMVGLAEAMRVGDDEAHVRAAANLASLHLDRGEAKVAVEMASSALGRRPGDAAALVNRAMAFRALARHEEESLDLAAALAVDPGYAPARFNRALQALAQGRLREGFAEYEWRWRSPMILPPHGFGDAPWLGEESLEGRSILVHEEQGLGDTLQFVRYAPLLAARGALVTLRVQPALARLLAGLGAVERLLVSGDAAPPHDLRVPLMSLPHAMGTDADSVPWSGPYLMADAAIRAKWRAWLGKGGRRRVGLAWAGSTTHRQDRQRSIALERLEPWMDCGVDWIGLQPQLRAGDSALLERWGVRDAGPMLTDFSETAALACELDLVVTVDTSVAHLAGALGRPVWLLLAKVPDWRWMLERTDTPWYPTMRIIRQRELGRWEDVIECVCKELRTT